MLDDTEMKAIFERFAQSDQAFFGPFVSAMVKMADLGAKFESSTTTTARPPSSTSTQSSGTTTSTGKPGGVTSAANNMLIAGPMMLLSGAVAFLFN